MNLSQLIKQVRQALNNRDHAEAERLIKQINFILNGSGDE